MEAVDSRSLERRFERLDPPRRRTAGSDRNPRRLDDSRPPFPYDGRNHDDRNHQILAGTELEECRSCPQTGLRNEDRADDLIVLAQRRAIAEHELPDTQPADGIKA